MLTKLIGKARAAFRRRGHNVPAPVPAFIGARDFVAHYHAAGEENYLCGRPYFVEQHLIGGHRPARTSAEVMCNRCQRKHVELLRTPEGRKRLGVDKYAGEPLRA